MRVHKYENKPFKPPKRLNDSHATQNVIRSTSTKRQGVAESETTSVKKAKPMSSMSVHSSDPSDNKRYFTLMYRKPTQKKHKTWAGDGYATFREGGKLSFYDATGKSIGSAQYKNAPGDMLENLFKSSGLEIQLDYEVSDAKEYQEVKNVLLGNRQEKSSSSQHFDLGETSLTVESSSHNNDNQITPAPLFQNKRANKFKPLIKTCPARNSLISGRKSESESHTNPERKMSYQPVFDASKIDDPIIMNKHCSAEVDVIVDPFISKNLRSHQREGIKFMYDCVLGLSRPPKDLATNQEGFTSRSIILEQDSDIRGCLLADEMGLGKTLMTISLIWTLLKQTPIASTVSCSQSGVPLQGLISKVLIICPVTLIANWKKEFSKWLNLSRIGILTLSPQNTLERDKYEVRTFLRVQRTYQVMILGYEKLLSVSEELEKNKSVLDLLVCDEGHRLKNGSSKILNVLKSLDIQKKILLSGTPIQNDLNEFYNIIDFINPGILGSYQHFKKRFILPISKARDPSNRHNETAVQKGEELSQEMIEITQRFILRRTSSVIESYLPPRMDLILFCRPTETQVMAFKDILQNCGPDLLTTSSNSSLSVITLLKKVCNSPSLIESDAYFNTTLGDSRIFKKYTQALNSGKLKVLMTLLERIRNGTEGEKVVIVSNYTQTLDIIQNLMISADMRICRLDGSTPSKQRDGIVTSFNRDLSLFALLLSAKSGGVGLNLIGASRLILFDNDWNPSVDLQAMSRIHRDGQTKPCYIYRLVTTGCIDEKILQRQLMKQSLSQKFLSDCNNGKDSSNDDLFNKEDLKDLFSVILDTPSNTHDLICSCDGAGEEVNSESVASTMNNKGKRYSPDTWISALEAQKLLEDKEDQNLEEKASLMKRCLVGYKHIGSKHFCNLLDTVAMEAAQNAQSDVTFAFMKPS